MGSSSSSSSAGKPTKPSHDVSKAKKEKEVAIVLQYWCRIECENDIYIPLSLMQMISDFAVSPFVWNVYDYDDDDADNEKDALVIVSEEGRCVESSGRRPDMHTYITSDSCPMISGVHEWM